MRTMNKQQSMMGGAPLRLFQLKTTTPPVRPSSKQSPLRRGFLLIPLVLAWIALSPTARAVDPPPDGGYPNANTAEGEGASSTSRPAPTTRPAIFLRSSTTPTATSTRPAVLLRS